MKARWISINDKMPILNEIIYYKGNINGQRARNMGNGVAQLPNGETDKFDEWKPKIYCNSLRVDLLELLEPTTVRMDRACSGI